MAGLLRLAGLAALLTCLLLAAAAPVSAQTPAYSVFFQTFPACSLAVDAQGSVYVALCGSASVLKFNASLAPVASSFNAQAASVLSAATVSAAKPLYLQSMAVTASGLLWLLDTNNLQLLLLSSTSAPTGVTTFNLTATAGRRRPRSCAPAATTCGCWSRDRRSRWRYTRRRARCCALWATPARPTSTTTSPVGLATDTPLARCTWAAATPYSAFNYFYGQPSSGRLLRAGTRRTSAHCDIRKFTLCRRVYSRRSASALVPTTPSSTSIAVDAAGTVYAIDSDRGKSVRVERNGLAHQHHPA